MSRHRPFRPNASHGRARDGGFVTAEYVVVTVALILALFTPVGESTAGATAFDFVLTSMRQFQDHSMFLLSLP